MARVDRVPTPKLGWYACYGKARCATVALPLDYDQPDGPTTQVAVLKLPARSPARRVGSLFVNPGGPGGSGTQAARVAAEFLSPELLDRFDVVGIDPRGVAASDQVRCFANSGVQQEVVSALVTPDGAAQEKQAVLAARAFGRACSTTGQPLASAVSTANAARDMDVLRRAVGDTRLTYLGLSYGTYLGQVYADLFPDRMRALALDGVVDPLAWAGTPATADVPVTQRLRSAEASHRALREMLERCDAAGGTACSFAVGDPVATFELVARRLRAAPLVLGDEPEPVRYTYSQLVEDVLGDLYDPSGSASISDNLAQLVVLTEPPTKRTAPALPTVRRAFAERLRTRSARPPRFDFPYYNDDEAFSAVLCADSLNPPDAAAWSAAAHRADVEAPYFGASWTWSSAQCARSTWTAQDEDAHRGPFTARTSLPVLYVGNYWDPATNYESAVRAARLRPGSRLLLSDSWGHTAYGSSTCVTGAVDSYLVRGALPPAGKRCVGDVQPYATPSAPTGQDSTEVDAAPVPSSTPRTGARSPVGR